MPSLSSAWKKEQASAVAGSRQGDTASQIEPGSDSVCRQRVEEVDAFVADKSPMRTKKQVDRLLASPHYGERWGRQWLDAARYADSDASKKINFATSGFTAIGY